MAKAGQQETKVNKHSITTTPLEMLVARNNFYLDAYHRLLKIALALIILIALLTWYGNSETKRIPEPVYFITDPSGLPVKAVPRYLPMLSDAELLEWAGMAATESYTFDFVNWRTKLQQNRRFFTRKGYDQFLEALNESQNLEAVKTRKLLVHAKQTGIATILDNSTQNKNLKINGAYTWLVQIPMVLTYENDKQEEKITQKTILTATVVRQSSLSSEDGVGIHSFVIRQV